MAQKLASLHHIDYGETLASLGEGDKLEAYSVLKRMSEDIKQMMSQTPESYKDKTKEEMYGFLERIWLINISYSESNKACSSAVRW